MSSATAGRARKSLTRSICVYPARDAKAIVPSTWTWPPIKRSFCRTITKAGLRPRYAYAMGWIHRWARLASLAPGIANAMAQLPGAKLLAGIAPQRKLPRFAPTTFKQWFQRRGTRNKGMPEVILWADTFNNYFHPEVAAAATEVLEDAGFRVVVPRAPLCCGRPLYDYGFLDSGRRASARYPDEPQTLN